MGSWIRTEVDSKQNAKALRRSGCGIWGPWIHESKKVVNKTHKLPQIRMWDINRVPGQILELWFLALQPKQVGESGTSVR